MCVGDVLEVTCTIDSIALVWKVNGASHAFTAITSINASVMLGGVQLTLVSVDQDLVTTAIVKNINSNHNGTVLTCLNYLVPEDMASITIVVQGKSIVHTNSVLKFFHYRLVPTCLCFLQVLLLLRYVLRSPLSHLF